MSGESLLFQNGQSAFRPRRAEQTGALDSNFPLMQLVTWPERGFRPSHCAAMENWHCVGWSGLWATKRMLDTLGTNLLHSDRSVRAIRKKWQTANARFLFRLPNGGLVYVNETSDRTWVSVWEKTAADAQHTFEELAAQFQRRKGKAAGEASFFVVVATRMGYGCETIRFRTRKRDAADLCLHYGRDFADWDNSFRFTLARNCRGLSVFRGEPGTGKTRYLRHLMKCLARSHRFYYLPASSWGLITAPDAVEFWIGQTVSFPRSPKVVVIEDAETLLMQRDNENRERLSNLLNVSDGFLAEYLRLHVICTLNCSVELLDPALLRPGRLVAYREFRRLSHAEASALARHKGLRLDCKDSYSLAEIYNPESSAPANRRNSIGFNVE
jgi:hypothetical protein